MKLVFAIILAFVSFLPPAYGDDAPKQLLAADARWKMRFDFRLDGELKDAEETKSHRLTVRNNRITGRTVEGDSLAGEIVDGEIPVVTLRQDGPEGFVCFYCGKRLKEGHIVGTWFNSRGQSGDFELVLEKK
jgi:hypothetical protein